MTSQAIRWPDDCFLENRSRLGLSYFVPDDVGVEITASRPRPRRRWSEDEVNELWAGWPLPRREHYVATRLRALEWLGTDEDGATPEERVIAASWATERALAAEALDGEEVET